jgi:hypothetical protein
MNKYQNQVVELQGKPSSKFIPPAPSNSDLIALEAEIGVPLPADYREFVREFGGYDLGRFEFYGVLPDRHLDLLDWHRNFHDEWGMPEDLMPIANDMGGSQLCIAISGDDIGAIYMWILQEPAEPGTYDNCERIAGSFHALMHSNFLLDSE